MEIGLGGNKKAIIDLDMDKSKCEKLDGRPVKKPDGMGGDHRHVCVIPSDDDIEVLDITEEGKVKARNKRTGEEIEGEIKV